MRVRKAACWASSLGPVSGDVSTTEGAARTTNENIDGVILVYVGAIQGDLLH